MAIKGKATVFHFDISNCAIQHINTLFPIFVSIFKVINFLLLNKSSSNRHFNIIISFTINVDYIYFRDVDKIDIFVGMHAEKPAPGALVGITTACVLGEQFKNLKYGDRFWYENTERDGWTQGITLSC